MKHAINPRRMQRLLIGGGIWSDYAPGAYYILTDDGCSYEYCIVASSLNLSDNYTQAVQYFSYYKPADCAGVACGESFDLGKNNYCDGQCVLTGPTMAGNPVHIFTGTKMQEVKDYTSTSGHLDFFRYYASNDVAYNSTNMLGRRWRHSYQSRLTAYSIDGEKVMMLSRPSGNYYRFRKSGSEWRTDADVQDRLSAVFEDGVSGWYVKNARDEREYYSNYGLLMRVEYPDGDVVSLSYDEELRLFKVGDRQGRALIFNYSGSLLSGLSGPDGTKVLYSYDGTRLVAAEYESDFSQKIGLFQYLYENSKDPNLLTGIIDESGQRYASWSYDDNGLAVNSRHGGVNSDIEKITVVRDSGKVSVTNALGQKVNYDYILQLGRAKLSASETNCDTCLSGAYLSRAYDVNGYPQSTMDFSGNSTLTQYDARGLLVSRADAVNHAGVEKRTIQTDWHADFRKPVERRIYDAADILVNKSSWTYNARGQALTSSRNASVAAAIRTSATTYCEQVDIDASRCPLLGLTISTDGARTDISDTASYTYYPSDDAACSTTPATCSHRKGDLWKVTNALGQVTEYLSYDGAGRVLSIKDANGTITDFTYHPRGWLTASKVRGADDTSENDDRITLIDYWPTGLVKQMTQPDGAFTAFTYDAAHRLTDIADNSGNTLHYTLDNAGNRVKEDTKDTSGTLKRTLSRVYNQLGQLATQATASGDPTDFGYDANGNTTGVTDALGHKTQNDYDPLNRLARTLQDVGGIAAETKFSYDALDNLTKVTDPKGLDTTYAYNGLGDLTKLTSPDTGVTTYTYDSAGNRATQTDARNIKTTYSYDALNRLTKVAYPTSTLNVTYTYDVSQTTCASGETYAVGRLSRMQDTTGTTDYCYDGFGDLVRKVQTTNGKVFVLRYAYTKAGQLSRLTYPDGAAVDYVRNAQGQTTEVGVTPAGGTRQVLLGNATYYPFGPVASWSYGNGRPMQRVLDQDYRPLAVSDTRSDGLSTGFAFDPAGNLSALTAAGNTAPVVSLDYDALGRLTAFKDGPTGTVIDGYSYDATGNRLSAKVNTTTQTYTYPTTSHRLDAVAGTARTYDAIGNTTSIGGTALQFVYGASGRIGQAKRAGTVVMNYAYNGRGEQVRRSGKTNTYTLYDETGHWLGDYDANGAALQQAIWLDDLPVGVLAKNSLRYVQPDHLGTPRAVIDPIRDVAIWTWDLKGEAFGNTPPDQDPDKDGTAFVFDMRFPGQRYDAATGFNQNYFRDYDPATGRYGQSDPIGLVGGYSTYSYALGRSLNLSDSSGLQVAPPIYWMPPGPISPTGRYKDPARENPDGTYQDYPGMSMLTASEVLSSILLAGVDVYNSPIFGPNRHAASPADDSARRNQEYSVYKEFQRAGYQRDPDQCKQLKNRIDFLRKLNVMRQAWDVAWPHSNWPEGRHAKAILDDENTIQRLEQQYRIQCQNDCL